MYSVIHLPQPSKLEKEKHYFLQSDQKFIFMQTDLVTQNDGKKWIEENVSEDVDNHWVIKTSSILKFNKDQFLNLCLHSELNLSDESSHKEL